MYAVIETGGKQYRVSPGQTVEVELLPAEPGSEVALDRVLLVSTGTDTLVGKPTVPGAHVFTADDLGIDRRMPETVPSPAIKRAVAQYQRRTR